MKTLFLKAISLPIKLVSLIAAAVTFLGFYGIVVPAKFLGRVASWPFRKIRDFFKRETYAIHVKPVQEANEELYLPSLEEEINEWYFAKKERREPKFPIRSITAILADFLDEDSTPEWDNLRPARVDYINSTRPEGWKAAQAQILTDSVDPTRSREGHPPVMVKNDWTKPLREARRTYARSNRKPDSPIDLKPKDKTA